MTNAEFITFARAKYQDEGTIEIDDNAIVSRGSSCGAYVLAWVWVDDDHPSENDPEPNQLQLTPNTEEA